MTINALTEFLAATSDERHALAPELVDGVGAERMEAILAATWQRVGPFESVAEGSTGLLIVGSRGRVPVLAQTRPDGRLASLYIAARPLSVLSPLRNAVAQSWIVLIAWPLALAVTVLSVWTAASVSSWLSGLAVLGVFLNSCLGFGAPSTTDFPQPVRWLLGLAAVSGIASALRLGGLPTGSPGLWTVAPWAALLLLVGAVVQGRRHRLDTQVSAPLHLPVDDGTWYIGQGGGRWLNHHFQVPDQRGAIDLVKLRPNGTRATGVGPQRDPAAYAAYGTPLFAPCDGTVLQAVDGHVDQIPGRQRYAPPAGNFVSIDTGRERVLLAHLRPGSLRVGPGDRVRVGDLLGEVGNSGNTSEPHLHLQADRDGLGLELRFTGVEGGLWRGRRLVPPARR
ncbi:M23 family metallopeptidase [Streptacidiphilus sp. PAMC 29251]